MKKIYAVIIIIGAVSFMGGCLSQPEPPSDLNASQAAGWQIYQSKKCYSCHTIGDDGGKAGPDLTNYASKRDEKYTKKFLKNPKSVAPKGRMPDPRLNDKQIDYLTDYLMTLK